MDRRKQGAGRPSDDRRGQDKRRTKDNYGDQDRRTTRDGYGDQGSRKSKDSFGNQDGRKSKEGFGDQGGRKSKDGYGDQGSRNSQDTRRPYESRGPNSYKKPQGARKPRELQKSQDFERPQEVKAKENRRPQYGNKAETANRQGQDIRRPGQDTRRPGQDNRRPGGQDFRKPEKDIRKPEKDIRRPKEASRVQDVDLLQEIQGQQDMDADMDRLEGRNSVLEALKADRSINRIYVARGEREGSINKIISMAREKRIVIQEVERTKLDEISVTHAHQGIIAYAAAKDYVEVDDILKIAEESGRPPFIIILDEISDAYNLGSILRTADASGVHGVIISKRRAVGLTAAVSKASAGAIEYVPVARVTNITQTIEYLKKNNIWVAGTDSTGEKPYYSTDLKGPIAVVIGSEGEGMGKLVRESCDFTVNIPMMGKISSLNAAVAGALVMFEIQRQRSSK